MHIHRHPLRQAVVAAAALCLAACSSSSPSSTGAQSGGPAAASRAAAVRQDTALYNSLVGTTPKILGATGPFSVPPLTKKPPAGKLLAVINCTVPVCNDYTNGAEAAAKQIGWRVATVTTQFTPQGWRSAWSAVLQDKPAVILFGGIAPTQEILPQMQQARKQGALIVAYSVDRPAGGSSPINFEVDSPGEFVDQGAVQAYGAIATQHGAPSVVILTDPTIPSWIPMRAKIQQVISSVGGSVGVLDVSEANIGKSVPSQLVTYLQAHPGVKFVLPSFDDFLPGIPEALKAAGLSDVKILGTSASQSSVGLVQSGQGYNSIVHMTGVKGWWLVYAAAAIMNGAPPSDLNPPGPVAVATKANAAQFTNVASWPQSAVTTFQKALQG